MKRALLLALVSALPGCDFGGAFDAYCAETGRCDGGAEGDDGTLDAGILDAGTPDAGTPDAGTPDAGTPDAGTLDAGIPDAGIPDAGPPDAGLLPTCQFTTVSWNGSTTDFANHCLTGNLIVNISIATPDSACRAPVTVTSTPAGISLFSGADCGAPVALGTTGKSFRANRFGTFSWFVSVTDSRFTVSSSTYVTTVKAVLTVDAGQEPLRVGDCNYLEVSAQADGALARANGDVNLDTTFQQASAFLPNCGATKFTRDQAVTWVGVRPTAPGLLSVWVAGPGLDAGVATFTACSGAGGPCSVSAHCCQGSCVNTTCN